MKNETTYMPDFWSEVLTYLHTALSPTDRKETTSKSTEPRKVYIFKTSIAGFADVLKIDHPLSQLVGSKGWSIDLDDEDKVLRVVCSPEQARKIVKILQENGYSCTAMPY
jgi:hypothetical protein